MDIGLNISLLQWNIQGFINHKYVLELLIAKYKPNILALQETHIIEKNLHLLHIPGFRAYHHNKNYSYAKAGIVLFIKNNVKVKEHIKSTGDLLFQTIILIGVKKLCITNIYKECDANLTPTMVSDICLSAGMHHIFLEDFNSQNVLWGSSSNSPSGRIWQDFTDDKQLVILNDGSPTLFNTRNTLTSVDVSMSSADLAHKLAWSRLSMPEVGDHFPIIISNGSETHLKQFSPRFRDKMADWPKFAEKAVKFSSQIEKSTNINREAAQI